MTGTMTPLREALAAMLELVASHRPDLLPAYLDMACNSPARFAVLELASDFDVRDDRIINFKTIKKPLFSGFFLRFVFVFATIFRAIFCAFFLVRLCFSVV